MIEAHLDSRDQEWMKFNALVTIDERVWKDYMTKSTSSEDYDDEVSEEVLKSFQESIKDYENGKKFYTTEEVLKLLKLEES